MAATFSSPIRLAKSRERALQPGSIDENRVVLCWRIVESPIVNFFQRAGNNCLQWGSQEARCQISGEWVRYRRWCSQAPEERYCRCQPKSAPLLLSVAGFRTSDADESSCQIRVFESAFCCTSCCSRSTRAQMGARFRQPSRISSTLRVSAFPASGVAFA